MNNIDKIIEEIKLNKEVRKNVLTIKNLCKEHSDITIEPTLLLTLLKNDDPKVRKNTAIIFRYLKLDCYIEELVACFLDEENWIVKNEIVETLLSFEAKRKQLAPLKQYFDSLGDIEKNENSGHIEMMKARLFDLLRQYGYFDYPEFRGIFFPITVLLTSLDSNSFSVYEQLEVKTKKETALGVLAKINDIKQIESIRDYHEWLIVLSGFKEITFSLDNLSDAIVSSDLLPLLDQMHHQCAAYTFRIDTHLVKEERLKNDYVKRLGMLIQEKSKGRLYNCISDYDVEIRLMESKGGFCKAFLKLYTRRDDRFIYRQYALPTSIQPYVAASICQLIAPYTKHLARVIDFCCGTGTMLIERHKTRPCRFLLGVDIYGEAIKMARQNSYKAQIDINYVQRDFNRFSHSHRFDEVISNLPTQTANKNRKEIEELYMKFIKKSLSLLEKDGYIFAHTPETALMKKVLRFYKKDIEVIDEITLKIKKAESTLFILKVN